MLNVQSQGKDNRDGSDEEPVVLSTRGNGLDEFAKPTQRHSLTRSLAEEGTARNDFYDTLLTDAINDLSPEMLKKLGIYIIYGTMMRISFADIACMWQRHRGRMFEVVENLEKIIKEIVEDVQHGLLVKITPDAFICFFPDKPKQHSILRSLLSACTLQMHMMNNPIRLENDLIKVQICISYGPVYKRALHIQRKILYDYYGEVVDDILYRVNHKVIPKESPFVTVCNNNPLIKQYIKELTESSPERQKLFGKQTMASATIFRNDEERHQCPHPL